MNDLMRGAIAGAVATLPMTATIELINRSLPRGRQHELPPRQITEEVAERADVRHRTGERALDAATMINHFGFGAAAGAAYGPVARSIGLAPVAAGVVYGLTVWAGAYAGVLPALGLQRRPEERPGSLNATMIVGHVVWGAALGLVERRLRSRRPEERRYPGTDPVAAKTMLDPQEW